MASSSDRQSRLTRAALALAVAVLATASAAKARTWTVCAEAAAGSGCEFAGMAGIQSAIDGAGEGDEVRLRAGRYVDQSFRDVPFDKLVIRGAVVVDGRQLSLVGDEGAILDGAKGPPTSAIVVRGGRVTLRNLTITGFRAADTDDDTYDGHGLFFIDADAVVEKVRILAVAKMALTARGKSRVTAREVEILDGHVGIWLEETSVLELRNSVVRNNDSAGICAYQKSRARIANSTFDANRDDGVYTENDASIEIFDSSVVRNAPYGLRATGNSRIVAAQVTFADNAEGATFTADRGRIVSRD